MELKEARETGLFSCRVNIGEFFGIEKELEWVQLREATAGELSKMAVNDGSKASEIFMGLLPELIVDSSFTVNGEKAKPADVCKIITDKGTMYAYILTEWQASLPLAKGKSTKSGK